jgi:hypothetical protein
MKDDLSKDNDMFDAMKRGYLWDAENIKNDLVKIISERNTSNALNHFVRRDGDDKFYFIYDNDCNLFIFEKMIELRCDRESVFSSNQTIEYPIKTAVDIEIAYERFMSMIMENEEGEDDN